MVHPVRPSLRDLPARTAPQHKFAVGQTVALRMPSTGLHPKTKAGQQMAAQSTFEITRLMPQQGDLFHYRVKHAATGQERVVAEVDLHTDTEQS